MNRKSNILRAARGLPLFFALLAILAAPATAQIPAAGGDAPVVSTRSVAGQENLIVTPAPLLTANELQELVGPIALYPDNLLAIILPASAYPLQIVQAARFLEELESDSSLSPDQDWDESVVALLNYPEVIQMLNDDLDWTWQLGEAVIGQETDVLDAIADFRELAYDAGNLRTDEYQVVESDDEVITITQVEEKIVYVPYYVPEEVIVYQSRPVYHYYPTAYPVYYYPYPYGYRFVSGFFWGVTTAFTIGWSDYHLHVYHPTYYRHPYYGHRYDHRIHYRRPSINIFNNYYVDNHPRRPRDLYRDGSYWRPQSNSGARPGGYAARRYDDSARNSWAASNEGGANRQFQRGDDGTRARSGGRGTGGLTDNRSAQNFLNSSGRRIEPAQPQQAREPATRARSVSRSPTSGREDNRRQDNTAIVDNSARDNNLSSRVRSRTETSSSRLFSSRLNDEQGDTRQQQGGITQTNRNSSIGPSLNRGAEVGTRGSRAALTQSRSRDAAPAAVSQRSTVQARSRSAVPSYAGQRSASQANDRVSARVFDRQRTTAASSRNNVQSSVRQRTAPDTPSSNNVAPQSARQNSASPSRGIQQARAVRQAPAASRRTSPAPSAGQGTAASSQQSGVNRGIGAGSRGRRVQQ
jgi:hypothetical protein